MKTSVKLQQHHLTSSSVADIFITILIKPDPLVGVGVVRDGVVGDGVVGFVESVGVAGVSVVVWTSVVVGTSGVVGSVGAGVTGVVGDVVSGADEVAAAVDEAVDTSEPVMLTLFS